MKLLFMTVDFPFGNRGDNNFVKNEIEYYQSFFSKITIIATNNEKEICHKLPSNAVALQSNISRKNIFAFLKSFCMLLSKKTYAEVQYARKELKQKSVIGILKQIFKYYYAYCNLKKIILANVDDDTICLSYWLSSRAFTLAKLKEDGKIKARLVSKCHGFDCYISRGYLPFRREIDKQFEHIYFISERGRNDYLNNIASTFDTINAKNEVSRLGVAIEQNIDTFSDKYDANSLNIVSCSNVLQLKRLDIIIDALSMIKDIKINWTHFGDGKLLENVRAMANEKLKDNICFSLKGNVDNEEIRQYYCNNCIDLFINASDTEGIPVSVMEAYNYFIPAIGRNVGGMSEILLDKMIIEDEDITKGFVEKIRFYNSQNLEQKLCLRQEVKDLLKNKFDIEKNTKKVLSELV